MVSGIIPFLVQIYNFTNPLIKAKIVHFLNFDETIQKHLILLMLLIN